MNITFLMDPIHTLHIQKDTSYALMVAAESLGHTVSYCEESHIRIMDGEVRIKHSVGTPTQDPKHPFNVQKTNDSPASEIDIIVIRTDPPFDKRYLAITWILDLIKDNVTIINRPSGIRNCNEKLATLFFPSLIPQTSVIWSPEEGLKILKNRGHVIAKPIDGHGGKGVFNIMEGDSNARVIFETLSENGQHPIIVQPFVKEASEGDKRIIVNKGDILGAILRKQGSNDHRHNFFAGGTAKPYSLTTHDRQIVDTIQPYLKEEGLHFVGIDLLGPYLTEINVTSPTCLVEMSDLLNKDLATDVIKSWTRP